MPTASSQASQSYMQPVKYLVHDHQEYRVKD